MSDRSPRERILLAAMECLERDGMEGLTVRAISRQAGVNVAAVNYYFGSKERLLEEMRDRHLSSGFADPLVELEILLEREDLTRAEALRSFFAAFIGDMVRYPRTVEAYLHDALARQDYGGKAFSALGEFLEAFRERIQDALAEGDDVAQRIAVAQLWSAILFHGLLPRAVDPFVGLALASVEGVARYAGELVRAYFPRA
jgi:AcrR family transcriptional regulator